MQHDLIVSFYYLCSMLLILQVIFSKKERGVLKGFYCEPLNSLRKEKWLPMEKSIMGFIHEPFKPFDKMHMSCKE